MCFSVTSRGRNSLMSNMIRNAIRTIKYIWIQATKLPCSASQETVPKHYGCTWMSPAETQSQHLVPYFILPFKTNSFDVNLAPWSPVTWLVNLGQRWETSTDGQNKGRVKNKETKRSEMRNKEKAEVWKVSFLRSVWRQASNTLNSFVTVALILRGQLPPTKRIASVPVVI